MAYLLPVGTFDILRLMFGLFLFDIDDDKFGLGSCFEFNLPAADSRGDDKVGIVTPVVSVGHIVEAEQGAYRAQRYKLSSVSVPRNDEVGGGVGFVFVVAGLMIHNDNVFVGVELVDDIGNVGAVFVLFILSADDIESVVDKLLVVFEDMHAVLFEVFFEVF